MKKQWLLLLLAATIAGCDYKGSPSVVSDHTDTSANTPVVEFKQAKVVISDLVTTLKDAQESIPRGVSQAQGYRTTSVGGNGWSADEQQSDGTIKRTRKVQTSAEDIDQILEHKNSGAWVRRTEVVNVSATRPVGIYVIEGVSTEASIDLTTTFTNGTVSRSYNSTKIKSDNTTTWTLIGELPDGGKVDLKAVNVQEQGGTVNGKSMTGKLTTTVTGKVTTTGGKEIDMGRDLESGYDSTSSEYFDSWGLGLHPSFNLTLEQVVSTEGSSPNPTSRTLVAMVRDKAGAKTADVELGVAPLDYFKYPMGVITYGDNTTEDLDFGFAGDLNSFLAALMISSSTIFN
ncbi:hypothetical protein D3C72_61600 [compost metagenome]